MIYHDELFFSNMPPCSALIETPGATKIIQQGLACLHFVIDPNFLGVRAASDPRH